MSGRSLFLDAGGRMRPRYMSDGEIKAEMQQTRDRRRWAALATEMRDRELARAAHAQELSRQQGRIRAI